MNYWLHKGFLIFPVVNYIAVKRNQFSSVTPSSPTLCDPMDCCMPGFPVHHQLPQSLLKLMSIKSVMPSNHLILCHPLLLSVFPSIRVFSNESILCIRWPEYCSSASASVLPMNIQNWFPLGWTGLILQSKGLSSLLQHDSSKVSILLHSAFFMVQFSHPYMTTGKTIALTRRTFVSKVMCFLILSTLVIGFVPRSVFFNFVAAVTICSDCAVQENKVSHCFHCFPIYLPWSDGTGCHDLRFLDVEF